MLLETVGQSGATAGRGPRKAAGERAVCRPSENTVPSAGRAPQRAAGPGSGCVARAAPVLPGHTRPDNQLLRSVFSGGCTAKVTETFMLRIFIGKLNYYPNILEVLSISSLSLLLLLFQL